VRSVHSCARRGLMGKSVELGKAAADRKFLQLLRQCMDISLLQRMLRNHKKAPDWKKIAITRRIQKLESIWNSLPLDRSLDE